MVTSSRMPALTNPTRFGYTPCDVFFGTIRIRKDRQVVMPGDLLVGPDGFVCEFEAREGNRIITRAFECA